MILTALAFSAAIFAAPPPAGSLGGNQMPVELLNPAGLKKTCGRIRGIPVPCPPKVKPSVRPKPKLKRRNIRQDDRRGGHTAKRHIGKSDHELRARARQRNGNASSFKNRREASKSINEALQRNFTAIRKWLENGKGETMIIRHRVVGKRVGRVAKPSGEVVDGRGTRVFLRRDPEAPDGYNVESGHPIL